MRHFQVLVVLAGIALVASAQTPTVAGITNAASFAAGPIAPGEIVSIFGSNLADATPARCPSTLPLATSCAGVSVLVNGKAAPLFVVLASEVNFQVPVDITGTTATLQVTRQTGAQTLQSAVVNVAVAPTAPGLFTDGNGALVPSSTAQPGDTASAFGTGFGVTNPVVASGNAATGQVAVVAPVTVTVGGQAATVVYAGLDPGLVGTNEVTFKVPLGLPPPGNLPVVANVGGINSKSALLTVKRQGRDHRRLEQRQRPSWHPERLVGFDLRDEPVGDHPHLAGLGFFGQQSAHGPRRRECQDQWQERGGLLHQPRPTQRAGPRR